MNCSKSRTKRRLISGSAMLATYPKRLFNKISLSSIVVDSTVDRSAALDSRVRFYRSSLGRYSYVSRGTLVESTVVGSFCSIGGDCNIGGASHPLDRVSTSPSFHAGGNILGKVFCDEKYNPFQITTIDNDVWIGNGAKIKAGVHISTGAVIGMGSVVTKDVGPYEIWAGNPAKCIKKRFSDDLINKLLLSNWWEYPDASLNMAGIWARDPSRFIDELLTIDNSHC